METNNAAAMEKQDGKDGDAPPHVAVAESGNMDKKNQRTDFCGRFLRQSLLNVSYMMLAICTCTRGPTLLDLQQIYETSLRIISLSLITASVGGIVGAFLSGFLMEKFSKFKYLLMFEFVFGISVTTAMLPVLGSLPGYFVAMIFNGAHAAAVHTGSNVLCLEIWRGANHGGSFMHSMQSSFSLGALLSPLVAQPFLSVRINQTAATTTTLDPEVTSSDGLQTAVNSTAESSGNEEFSESSIYILYAFNGLILSALAMPFLYLGLKEVMQNRRFRRAERSEKQSEEEQHEQPQNVIYSAKEKWVIALVCTFFLFYVGTEFGIMNFLPAFAVKGALQLTKAQGASLLAFYTGPFLAARIASIFLAMKLRPRHILLINFFFLVTGNIVLLITAEKSWLWLRVGYALVGFGSGSMVGNTWMWLEQYFRVSSRVASLMSMSGGLGVNISPLVVGQVIEEQPMVLVYLQVLVTAFSIIIFTVATWIGRDSLAAEKERTKLSRKKNEEEAMTEEEVKIPLKVVDPK